MSTPTNHLIAISDLTFESWKFFTLHWKILLKKALWFAVGFTVYSACAGFAGYFKQNWIMIPGIVMLIIMSLISWMMLARTTLQLHAPENISPVSKSLPLSSLIVPMLLILILSVLANIAGYLVFILPGVWLSISLYFSLMFLLEDNMRGIDALKASYSLVKGRWWATFGRLALPAIFYGILFGVISFAMILIPIIVAVLAGAALIPFSEGASPAAIAVPVLILAVLFSLVWLAAYVILHMCGTVIQMIVHVKLFHSLKASRAEHPVQNT